jgi:DNA-binding transcriptional regulator YdaS (Cro superfamily)
MFCIKNKGKIGGDFMDLRLWLCKNRITSRDFAAIIGYDRTYISLVSNYRRRPSFALAKVIEEATSGEVRAIEIMDKPYDNIENHVALSA